MKTFNLEEKEIEIVQDLRKLSEHERRVFANAIRRSATERDPATLPPSDKIVPLVLRK